MSRFGIIVMLLQLGLTLVLAVKSIAISDPGGAMSVLQWTGYVMLANILVTVMLFIGAAMSLGELKRAGLDVTRMLVAVAGFAVATAALVWTYYVFDNVVDIITHLTDDDSLARLHSATNDLENLKYYAVAKDIGYGLGLLMLLRTVQHSAAANDQLAMRDDAAHMSRAIMVMLVGDLFYQLTYGLGTSGAGLLSGVGALLIGLYWIWCHVKLVRFFENAAHFMNEPHELPIATGVKVPAMKDLKPKPAPRTSRPSMPHIPDASAPPPVVVVKPPIVVAAPIRPATMDDDAPSGDGPKYLR
jgi:hypothetical protein